MSGCILAGMRQPKRILGVSFDVGETLINETTEYHAWADWLGVPRHTFSSVFGATIASGPYGLVPGGNLDYREAFQKFRPGFDLEVERQRRAAAGKPETFTRDDLYPNVMGCISLLATSGIQVSIAGNQTERAEMLLNALNFPSISFIATSASLGVSKPDLRFFDRVAARMDLAPEELLYVGDRLDNDIEPALRAGWQAGWVRQGPWGHIQRDAGLEAQCTVIAPEIRHMTSLILHHNASLPS